MSKYKQKIGKWGEGTAEAYLIKRGYTIIGRNFHSSAGEIDIIAQQEEAGEKILIFVEVKTRTSKLYGNPEDAFTWKKWNHLMGAIEAFLTQYPEYNAGWQVDVIAIQRLSESDPPDIQHFENIVMDDGRL
ncbi:MAG: YraN family protein [Anaerolineales bacterium]|nr:YraN family protein [Anaerolineales bacterium]